MIWDGEKGWCGGENKLTEVGIFRLEGSIMGWKGCVERSVELVPCGTKKGREEAVRGVGEFS